MLSHPITRRRALAGLGAVAAALGAGRASAQLGLVAPPAQPAEVATPARRFRDDGEELRALIAEAVRRGGTVELEPGRVYRVWSPVRLPEGTDLDGRGAWIEGQHPFDTRDSPIDTIVIVEGRIRSRNLGLRRARPV